MIRWGILGAGNIAGRFADSLSFAQDARLTAVSVRSKEKGEAFAARYPVQHVYLDHEELLADPAVDAVYLALPHTLHAEWAVKALSEHKAVLCEKPAVLTADEMRRIMAASRANRTFFMEAMKTRFVPLYPQIRSLVKEGAIGELRSVQTCLCNNVHRERQPSGHYYNQPASGGALYDAGTYCASWLEDFLAGDPVCEKADGIVRDGIIDYAKARLLFENGTADLECAFEREKPRCAVLTGTKGRILVKELPRPQETEIRRDGGEPECIRAPYEVDDFYGEICEVNRCLAQGKTESDVMPQEASLRCVRILEVIREGLTGFQERDGDPEPDS